MKRAVKLNFTKFRGTKRSFRHAKKRGSKSKNSTSLVGTPLAPVPPTPCMIVPA